MVRLQSNRIYINKDQSEAKPEIIQKWCIKNEFELIELNPVDTDMDETAEDPLEQSFGMLRVIQAIQAHSWPHSQLKGNTTLN